ncbi:MAG: CheR family methyltransferase [Nanoarchaeota archaeon]
MINKNLNGELYEIISNSFKTEYKIKENRITFLTYSEIYREPVISFFSYLERRNKEVNEKIFLVAPVSSGQEAYSLASLLLQKSKEFKIIGVDINEEALLLAKNGVVSLKREDFRNIEKVVKIYGEQPLINLFGKDYSQILLEFSTKGPYTETYNEKLKKYLSFQRKDILKEPLPKVDYTTSYNLLMYFSDNTDLFIKAFENLISSIKKDGVISFTNYDLLANKDALRKLNLNPEKLKEKTNFLFKFNGEMYLVEEYEGITNLNKI